MLKRIARRPLLNTIGSAFRSFSSDLISSSALTSKPATIDESREIDRPGHNLDNINVFPRKYGTVDPTTYDPRTAQPGSKFYRADDFPFDRVQPNFGTKKSHVNQNLELEPVDAEGSTTPALHVHGKPEDKAQSAFSSTSTNPKKAGQYGRDLLEFDPTQLDTDQIVSQDDIQADISQSQDPRFQEEARNVTQPGKPHWQPDDEQRGLAPDLGIDADKTVFTYEERAALNSKRDEENLLKGVTPVDQYWHGVDYDKFGKNLASLDTTTHPKFESRDPRSQYPPRKNAAGNVLNSGGYRIPVDEHGFKFAQRMAKARQEQAEVEQERKEDEKSRDDLSELTPDEMAKKLKD